MKPFNLILSVIAGLVMFISAAFAVDARYALHVEFAQLSERLDQKILRDKADGLTRRIWSLQDRYGKTCGTEKEQCRELREELDEIRRKQKAKG